MILQSQALAPTHPATHPHIGPGPDHPLPLSIGQILPPQLSRRRKAGFALTATLRPTRIRSQTLHGLPLPALRQSCKNPPCPGPDLLLPVSGHQAILGRVFTTLWMTDATFQTTMRQTMPQRRPGSVLARWQLVSSKTPRHSFHVIPWTRKQPWDRIPTSLAPPVAQ